MLEWRALLLDSTLDYRPRLPVAYARSLNTIDLRTRLCCAPKKVSCSIHHGARSNLMAQGRLIDVVDFLIGFQFRASAIQGVRE